MVRTPRGPMITPVEIKENKKIDNTMKNMKMTEMMNLNNVYASKILNLDKIESWLFNSSEFLKIQLEKFCKLMIIVIGL